MFSSGDSDSTGQAIVIVCVVVAIALVSFGVLVGRAL